VADHAILVVDDDPAIVATISEVLDFEGYSVHTASNGAEALAMVEHGDRLALVLLDMRMPVMDGWGFAQALKDRGLELPILVMTAAQDAKRWAAEIGANGCVPKPFDLPDLLTAVERVQHHPA
jgi:two-component system, chemotaxis family, chemotaxis protein CheY